MFTKQSTNVLFNKYRNVLTDSICDILSNERNPKEVTRRTIDALYSGVNFYEVFAKDTDNEVAIKSVCSVIRRIWSSTLYNDETLKVMRILDDEIYALFMNRNMYK